MVGALGRRIGGRTGRGVCAGLMISVAAGLALATGGCSEQGGDDDRGTDRANILEAPRGEGPPRSKKPPIVESAVRFSCTPTQVWDGDGPIWCAEGPRIRLAGIAAREMDETCRPNQPCPAVRAVDARDALVSLIGKPTGIGPNGHVLVQGPELSCVSNGSAGGSRTAAWCTLPNGTDLSCALVEQGVALPWERYWEDGHCAD
jgi:endonuclease YncB( thermonuclease family)